MEFTLKLDRFEGPYTKLLECIESRKLSITEVSLVEVSDEYIAYIKTLDQKDLVDISQFILVASTLMLMKAKSLLPGVVYTEEEEKQIHDLEYKLELYALLSKGSEKIKALFGKTVLYSRPHFKPKDLHVFIPDERVTPSLLQSVLALTLMSFVTTKSLAKVSVKQALRIENVIENILERVKATQSVTFQTLAPQNADKEEQKKVLIVNFIALLELLRAGSLQAKQHEDGGEIVISSVDQVPQLQ